MKSLRIVAVAGALAAVSAVAYFALAGHEQAPIVQYTTLDGARHSSEDLLGKVVLVNFWATSCVTCMKEMPALVQTHEKFKDRGYETLSVAMSYDPPAYVVNYAQSRKLPFRVAIDNTGAIAKSFGDVQLTPTSVLIDRKGTIVKRIVGEPDFAELHQQVEKLLAQG
ncbi:MAG TPA: TlpA disulfide reductase family protein [Burkholderiaceae bacterium]|jgi:peroxiredoxin|nr:TlpA disulfide reductase family protein [Burkholderiaceae bacterium]